MVKTKRYQPTEERTILNAMIVHDGVLGRISQNLGGEKRPFASKWSNLIARWCIDHFSKFGKAPRGAIEVDFTRFAESTQDESSVGLVEDFLSGLSEDHSRSAKEINEQFVVDLASDHFRKIRLERTVKAVGSALEKADLDSAEESLKGYEQIRFSARDWFNPFDSETIHRALQEKEDQGLVEFPGPLGEFLSQWFERDGFIAFAGPEKRGKSFWMLEVVYRALLNHRRVYYCVVGDMSTNQVERRLLSRIARRPLRPKLIKRPTRFVINGREDVKVKTRSVESKGLTPKAAMMAMKEFLKKTATNESRLRINCVESGMVSAGDIERDLANFERQGWVADVVVIDYADVLTPETHSRNWEYRHQINATWMVLRRISQHYHNLVVTATQTAATSYKNWLIQKGDFSEDKRKAAHVTGMLGINQTSEEKKQGIYRLNWVYLREGEWTDSQYVWTAGNLALSCPCIISSF